MSNTLKVDSTSSSPVHSPTSSISSFEEETYLESPLFSASRPFDAGTYRDAYTELNTTIVSEAKHSIIPPEEPEEAVELDAGLYTEDLDSRSADPRRSRTSSNKRVSASGTGRSTVNGDLSFATNSDSRNLPHEEQKSTTIASAQRRTKNGPNSCLWVLSDFAAQSIQIHKLSVFSARDFFLIIGLCVVLASAMILIARPAIYTVYEQSNILI
ncbi:hypothetical protein MD484_g3543, partial [Candolleomyces efflorescens]